MSDKIQPQHFLQENCFRTVTTHCYIQGISFRYYCFRCMLCTDSISKQNNGVGVGVPNSPWQFCYQDRGNAEQSVGRSRFPQSLCLGLGFKARGIFMLTWNIGSVAKSISINVWHRNLCFAAKYHIIWRNYPYCMGLHLWINTSKYKPIQLVDFFNLRNPSSRTVALGLSHPLTEMSTRNLPLGWQTHRHLLTDCLENVGASTSHSPIGLHDLLQR
jgi:hypothetical protein